jgi:hypothetical protein
MRKRRISNCWPYILLMFIAQSAFADIEPWPENPRYWSYGHQPVLLAGGSDDDNLFQWPVAQLLPHLDKLQQSGGNLVRNTMSDRRDKGFEIYPYKMIRPGEYDLNQWNPEYWERFDRFLAETGKRKIIVQIELWDRFDFSDHGLVKHWQAHPYNPKNNINYTRWASKLSTEYPDHPGKNKQAFFFTTPEQRNNTLLLNYQKRFIDEVLQRTLKYGHVLYCIDNETKADEAWSRFWAQYVKNKATRAGKRIYVTEMLDERTMDLAIHGRTISHPELYDFVEVSQNNHNDGAVHWQNLQKVRSALQPSPRPMNSIKVYGAKGSKYGDEQQAMERFWRNLLAGVGAIRFHRPESGIGLNDQAIAALKSLRALESKVSLIGLKPVNLEVIGGEAYGSSASGQHLVYLPKGQATVQLDSQAQNPGSGLWLNLQTAQWEAGTWKKSGKLIDLVAPRTGHWIFIYRQ